ncbi:MAG: amidohydrolase [Thaumarchaeota archaeon]|nr:amidohydrolase [Nitrososphaerota archaeon]
MNSLVRKLPEPTSILIRNARFVLTNDGYVSSKSIFIQDRKIVDIGESEELVRKYGTPQDIIEADSCIVAPGLVNNHSHIAMSLLRGFAEDLPLLSWLRDKIWPAEAKLQPQDIYLGALIGCIESLLAGTTTITSIYFYSEHGSEAHAVSESGLRGVLAHGVFDWTAKEALSKTEEFVKHWHGHDEGRVRIATSPHAPYSCSPDLLKEIEDLRVSLNQRYGNEHRVLNTLHVSEARNERKEIEERYKVSVKDGVARYLDGLGVLNAETICAHSIHLTDDDFASMKRTGASIASCPVSNLKVGMGIAEIPRAISQGVTVSLGTDGAASNNSLDMFETMKMASLLQKGYFGDTTLMKSRETFELASAGGARSMHRVHEIGSIAKGKKADLMIVNISGVHSTPLYDPFNHLVYSAKSSDVRDVIVDGRVLVRDRKVPHIDIEGLKSEASKAVERLDLSS